MYDKFDEQPHNVQRKQHITREGSTGESGSSGNPQNPQKPVVQPAAPSLPVKAVPQQAKPVAQPPVAPAQPRAAPKQYVTHVTIVYNPTIINNVYVGSWQQQARPNTQPPVAPPRPQPVSQQQFSPSIRPAIQQPRHPQPPPVVYPPVYQEDEEEIPDWLCVVGGVGLIVLLCVIAFIIGWLAISVFL